jgi:hypothetical protein
MTRRIYKHAAALLVMSALLAAVAGAASAATVYNNIPSPLPGNLPSWGFEATQSSEFGGEVEFSLAPQQRNPTVAVIMSSWGCERGNWNWPRSGAPCATRGGSTFSWPVTLNIYETGVAEDSVGPLIKTVTQTFTMPYRPSASSKCTGANTGKWFTKGKCFNGKAFKIQFGGLGLVLPRKAIISVAYNTSDYGAEKQRPQPCDSEEQGCPYDSLNVAIRSAGEGGPSIGSDPAPEDVFLNSITAADYCANPGGVGTFAVSEGEPGECKWTEEQPAFEVYKTSR